ncbi:LysR family transcriptional regulator [Photobacterium sp. GSS17]|uniref:LysR family transcriptional regulator n=1 Tax=Photobacterium sp. GSS17 TaxID=3020715 RepID=UPI00235EB9D6|nr:LysR family transcriptional regulator [Photobacterium sp. GSS17]
MLLEGIETLLVLAREGTMSKAGSRLYLSQSAVSKRIAKLEKRMGKKLIEPDGRRIKLTPDARQLIAAVGPGFHELKGLIADQLEVDDHSLIRLACSETLVAGYLAPLLGEYVRQDPYLSLSTHHTPVIVEKVQSGEATLGICAGYLPAQHGIQAIHLFDEPFKIVSQTPLTQPPTALLTNDLVNTANTYQAGLLQNAGIVPLMQMDSYTAAAQLALNGVAAALVPMSTIRTLNIPDSHCFHFEFLDTLTRPVNICYRQKSYQVPRIRKLIETIVDFVQATV